MLSSAINSSSVAQSNGLQKCSMSSLSGSPQRVRFRPPSITIIKDDVSLDIASNTESKGWAESLSARSPTLKVWSPVNSVSSEDPYCSESSDSLPGTPKRSPTSMVRSFFTRKNPSNTETWTSESSVPSPTYYKSFEFDDSNQAKHVMTSNTPS